MNQDNKRLSINIAAQIVTFAAQMLISFFLTPFIIKKLGADAYGYIGLTDSFVMYAQIIVLALNSMAGRFVTIAYHQGNIGEAKKLFSSVYYANIITTAVLFLISLACVGWLEYFINIPDRLIVDVKILFSLMFLNFMISVSFSTYQLATFIKNRLELNAIRTLIANIARVSILFILFGFFIPHLWYMGIASVACTLYIAYTNIGYTRKLTPKLKVSIKDFDFSKIKMLISSGIWNAITKLGNLIGQGLDLLFANLFISSLAMGYVSITKRITVIILGLVASICAAFAPSLTKYYAKKDFVAMKKQLLFSVKFAGFISLFPFCFVYTVSDVFYKLWLPGQDYSMLYILTILGNFALPVALSLEGVQNIFSITNKVKIYSIFATGFNLLMFLSLVIGLRFIPEEYRIYYLVTVHSVIALGRVAIFLPIYGAMCINEKKGFFFPDIFRVLFVLILSCIIMLPIKKYMEIDSWLDLIIYCIIITLVCLVTGSTVLFNKAERNKVFVTIRKKINFL